eukprot:4126055-Pyramimonas_sp.AAC.1
MAAASEIRTAGRAAGTTSTYAATGWRQYQARPARTPRVGGSTRHDQHVRHGLEAVPGTTSTYATGWRRYQARPARTPRVGGGTRHDQHVRHGLEA